MIEVREYYNGSRWIYEAKGRIDPKEFIAEIMKHYKISIGGQSFGEVVNVYKRWGIIKEESRDRRGYSYCTDRCKDAEIFTRAVLV